VLPYDDLARARTRVAAFDRARTLEDLRAAIEWSRSPAVIALGICLGGLCALDLAAAGLVDGVVTWHGTRLEQNLEHASRIRCPMRLHFGAADPFVPSSAVEAVRAAFRDRSDVEIAVHDGATHGFSHRGARAAYDPAAESAGMGSVRELIERIGRAKL
jgi:carboxymethylenebutenolidase